MYFRANFTDAIPNVGNTVVLSMITREAFDSQYEYEKYQSKKYNYPKGFIIDAMQWYICTGIRSYVSVTLKEIK